VRLAFVFPGQGSHRAGALAAWAGHPAAAILVAVAAGSGRDLFALDEDPAAGRRTADAQPSMLAASLVAWRALSDAGLHPDLVAGHSLGDVAAAVAGGTLSPGGGAVLAAARGEAMAAACREHPGGMAAVLSLGRDAVEVIVEGIDDAFIATDNAPRQTVVAGPPSALESLRERVRFAGGRLVRLDVEGPFHTPAMASAVHRVTATLGRLSLRDPLVPIVSASSVLPLTTAAEVAQTLVGSMLARVRWREVQARLVDLGVTDIVEVGPGGVLSGLARRSVPDVSVHTVTSPADVEVALDALGRAAVEA
jgi:[acyl-carrier-protein] S-malonyltransferase